MKIFRFLPFFLIVLSICFIFGAKGALSIPIPQGPVAPIDPNKIPIPEAGPLIPVGFLLDANDQLFFSFDENFSFQTENGSELEYSSGQFFHLEMRSIGAAPEEKVLFGIRMLGPSDFQFQVRNFDPQDYEMVLTRSPADGGSPEEIKLDPEEKFFLKGGPLQATRYPGTSQPPPTGTLDVFLFNDPSLVYMVEVEGTLTLWANPQFVFKFPNPPSFEFPDQPTPEPTPPVGSGSGNPPPLGPGNPSLNGPSGDTGIPPQPTGVSLSGGGGIFDCSLQGSGQPKDSGQETLLFTMSLALLSGHYLVRRRRIRRFPF